MNPSTNAACAEQLASLIQKFLAGSGSAMGSGGFTLADLLAAAILLGLVIVVFLAARAWVERLRKISERRKALEGWPHQIVQALSWPVYALIWLAGAHLILAPLLIKAASSNAAPNARLAIDKTVHLALFAIGVWLAYRLTDVLRVRLEALARKSESKVDDLLVPAAIKSLRVALPLIAIFLCLPILGLPVAYDRIVSKIGSLVLIGVAAWIVFQGIGLIERFILLKYDVTAKDNLEARKIYTQVKVLGKTACFVTTLFAIASMLMVFEEARRFGASILASAGVVGIILGFAAQRTISNLFAGFQIAMTQPIRIDDVVIVEGEWGRVEEITLTYVVIAIWDQRRLIVPLSHFIEKPFQNWTRVSAELLGAVFLYVDYAVPMDPIRAEVKRIVENHPDWDKRFWNVQVTDATERAVQIRVLVTAADSGKAWTLRCDVRERLIDFLQKHHPGALPKVRAEFPEQIAPRRSNPESQAR